MLRAKGWAPMRSGIIVIVLTTAACAPANDADRWEFVEDTVRYDTAVPVSRPTGPAPEDTGRVARAVHGVAEFEFDPATRKRADYVRVTLKGSEGVFEAVTNQQGEFVFENVPSGMYQLVVTEFSRPPRTVHQAPIEIGDGESVRIPDVRITRRQLRATTN